MAKAAALMGSSPWITFPDSLTRMRSETRMREKSREWGFSPASFANEYLGEKLSKEIGTCRNDPLKSDLLYL